MTTWKVRYCARCGAREVEETTDIIKRHRPAEPQEAEEDYWFGGANIANEELWMDQSEDYFANLDLHVYLFSS